MALSESPVVVIDVETTGLSPDDGDRVVEFGLVRLDRDLRVECEYTTLVNPERPMGATRIHGIRGADVVGAPTFADIAGDIGEFCSDAVLAGHNAGFDVRFLISEFDHVGLAERMPSERALAVLDTLELSRQLISGVPNYKLPTVCQACGIPPWSKHGAITDARATAGLLAHLASTGGGLATPRGRRMLNAGWTSLAPSGQALPRKTLAGMASAAGDRPAPTSKPLPLLGEFAVFTGGLGIVREEAERAARMLGCEVRATVSGKTTIVVVGDADVGRWAGVGSGATAKHRQAMERLAAGQRIRILAESDFLRLAQVVSDGVITEDEWLDVRELVYAVNFAVQEGRGEVKARRQRRTKSEQSDPATPVTVSSTGARPKHSWRALAFLQSAVANTPQEALKVLEQFVPMLMADINGFSGTHEMDEVEGFVRALPAAPEAVRAFLGRTRGMEPFALDLVRGITESAHAAAEQAVTGLERVAADLAAKEDTKRALAAAREVEASLRPVAAATPSEVERGLASAPSPGGIVEEAPNASRVPLVLAAVLALGIVAAAVWVFAGR